MKRNIKYWVLLFFAAAITIVACKKTTYTFGSIKTPSNVALTTTIQGASANATGDGSGNISVSVTATNALAYKIFWGNGDSVLTTTGQATYKYTKLDTNLYTISVSAIGTGGAITTISKQVKVLYKFQIPPAIITNLTGGTTKNWAIAKDTIGHFGVGPITTFTPDYYKAGPNEKANTPCAYNGTITFALAGANAITMNDMNNNSSFLIAAATSFYGQSGGDGCYVVNSGGVKNLGFSGSNSGSTASNSTQVQFNVPGNGLVNFGTGGSTYEIISLTSKVMVLRNIGSDGNAWYQILRAQ